MTYYFYILFNGPMHVARSVGGVKKGWQENGYSGRFAFEMTMTDTAAAFSVHHLIIGIVISPFLLLP